MRTRRDILVAMAIQEELPITQDELKVGLTEIASKVAAKV